MQAGPMDFVEKAGKGNDNKSNGNAIILKRPLPAAEVDGGLWLPPDSCGASAAQHGGERFPLHQQVDW